MKNMNVSKKIVVSFGVVIILTLLLAVTAVVCTLYVDTSYGESYDANAKPLPAISSISTTIGNLRLEIRNAVIYGTDNQEAYQSSLAQVEELKTTVNDALRQSEAYMDSGEELAAISKIRSAYENDLLPVATAILDSVASGDTSNLVSLLHECNIIGDGINEDITTLMSVSVEQGDVASQENTAFTRALVIAFGVFAVAALVVASFMMRFLIKSFKNPILEVSHAAERVAVGDVDITITNDSKDEIGDMGRAFIKMAEEIRKQADMLAVIAKGDYTVSMPVRSDKDVMNQAINDMVASNNSMVGNIRASSVQITTGSQQVAQGAQDLASASSQQAATIEEFSATVAQIQAQAEDNSKISLETLEDVNEAGQRMGDSIQMMSQMLEVMSELDENSQNISKVIKVIDDIAFQTNILALNAAVEAARAGEHGKGFAVVADEVRDLASKSADAAKETGVMIQKSTESVAKSNQMVQKTNESLQAVGVIAGRNVESITKINEASQQQSAAMTEINAGIGQLSTVVQGNSATAQQSAAAAEEMSAQASALNADVQHFQLKDGDGVPRLAAQPGRAALPESSN